MKRIKPEFMHQVHIPKKFQRYLWDTRTAIMLWHMHRESKDLDFFNQHILSHSDTFIKN
ncbi:MAG: hypothetical protein ACP5JO_06540 [Candidatus Ratteibacteria bacterium]